VNDDDTLLVLVCRNRMRRRRYGVGDAMAGELEIER